MKKYITIAILMVFVAGIFGCNAKYEPSPNFESPEMTTGIDDNTDYIDDKPRKKTNEEKIQERIEKLHSEGPKDIVEKRGDQTNITEYQELMARLSGIISFEYLFSDTKLGITNQQVKVYGRYQKIENMKSAYNDEEIYNELFLDRVEKEAFSHCSKELCPEPKIDKELERIDYEPYAFNDPYEYASKVSNPEFIGEKMVENQYTKVFKINFEGKPARIWLQEYYGFPLRIEIVDGDEKRIIKFEDMEIDNLERPDLDMPFGFSIKGEEGIWFFWDHYLGLWPPPGYDVRITEDNRVQLVPSPSEDIVA